MHVTCVHVHVKSDRIEEFRQASILNHQESIQEPGNQRFDILQSKDAPTLFLLYEAYESEANSAAHKSTPRYEKWRETVADWMAEPRKGVPTLLLVTRAQPDSYSLAFCGCSTKRW